VVLTPSYIEVDGLVVLLQLYPATPDEPAGVRMRSDFDRPPLRHLMFVTSALMARVSLAEALALIDARQPFPMPYPLTARPTNHEDDYTEDAARWEQLAGWRLDLDDAYYIEAGFLRDPLVIPTSTLRRLVARLYELDADIASGRVEARMDESVLVPPPLPPLPPATATRWEDDEVPMIEEGLAEIDRIDPLTDAMTDPDVDRESQWRRRTVFGLLGESWRRTHAGEDDLPARYRRLNLPFLLAYSRAMDELMAYLQDPERIAITRHLPPPTPFQADVSVDLFRLPQPRRPPGYSLHVWLAHAEAAFVYSRQTGNSSGGDMFTRIDGHMVRLRYRYEVRTVVPVLWRVELA
jgi:hypothetical protein